MNGDPFFSMQSWLVNNMIPILGGNQGFSSATAVVVVVIVVGVGVERIAASGRFDQQWLLARTFDSFRCEAKATSSGPGSADLVQIPYLLSQLEDQQGF